MSKRPRVKRCFYRLLLRVRRFRCQRPHQHRGWHSWTGKRGHPLVRWMPPKEARRGA